MDCTKPVPGVHMRKGRQPHLRPDGSFTVHDYVSWGQDYRHQFSGFDVLCEIKVCMRPMPGGRICGHESSKPVSKIGK